MISDEEKKLIWALGKNKIAIKGKILLRFVVGFLPNTPKRALTIKKLILAFSINGRSSSSFDAAFEIFKEGSQFMAVISNEEQLVVWGYPETYMSDNTKAVWQFLADSGGDFSFTTAPDDISAAMGGSVTPTEVQDALTSLQAINGIAFSTFTVSNPTPPPPPA